jgi:Uri superfamily endonuclease
LKGIYVLIIQVVREVELTVGALGALTFKPGLYAYVGSAQANLEQRVKRHLMKEKRLFWHIDYLLDNASAKIVKVLYQDADKSGECAVADRLSEKGEPVAGFGCSDCGCGSHLFRVGGDYGFLLESMRVLDVFS